MKLTDLSTDEERQRYLFYDRRPGTVMPIFIHNSQDSYRYECDAELVEPLTSWREHTEPELFFELGENDYVLVVRRMWRVRVVSENPFDNGTELIRWVLEYYEDVEEE